jgi:hypothetical protein
LQSVIRLRTLSLQPIGPISRTASVTEEIVTPVSKPSFWKRAWKRIRAFFQKNKLYNPGDERLVDKSLVSWAYLQAGMIETIGCFFSFFMVFGLEGIPFWQLFGTARNNNWGNLVNSVEVGDVVYVRRRFPFLLFSINDFSLTIQFNSVRNISQQCISRGNSSVLWNSCDYSKRDSIYHENLARLSLGPTTISQHENILCIFLVILFRCSYYLHTRNSDNYSNTTCSRLHLGRCGGIWNIVVSV